MSTGQSGNLRIWYIDSTITFRLGSPPFLLLLGDDDVSGPIPAGVVKDLINTVVLAADGTPFTSAALCLIRLEQDGDADDGKYWDGDSWEVAADPPASAHTEAGQHFYQLPAAATTGRDGARLVVTFTDTITEGSMTTLCGTQEYLIGTLQSETDAAARAVADIAEHDITQALIAAGVTPDAATVARLLYVFTHAGGDDANKMTHTRATILTPGSAKSDDSLVDQVVTQVDADTATFEQQ